MDIAQKYLTLANPHTTRTKSCPWRKTETKKSRLIFSNRETGHRPNFGTHLSHGLLVEPPQSRVEPEMLPSGQKRVEGVELGTVSETLTDLLQIREDAISVDQSISVRNFGIA